MASHAIRLTMAALICQALLASGCQVASSSIEAMRQRHEIARQVARTKAEYHADCKEAELMRKLAVQEERLRQLEAGMSTDLETTMAMEINQSLEFEDITVDVEELKRVIARAEAQARAEALRLRRLPQLLRDQEEALRQGAAEVMAPPPVATPGATDVQGVPSVQPLVPVQPTQFSGGELPGPDADMVVGIDQFGNPLPIDDEPTVQISPWEIPFNMRVRLNLGVNNPRVQEMRVRRRHIGPVPNCCRGCGRACEGSAHDCDACAQLDAEQSSMLADAPPEAPKRVATTRTESRYDSFQNAVKATGFHAEPGAPKRLPAVNNK